MNEPTRLRLDPDTPADLRHALDAEVAAPLGHDVAALKAGLTNQIAAGGAATSGVLLPKVLIAGVLAAGGAWWLGQDRAPEPPPAPAAPMIATATAEPAATAAAPARAPDALTSADRQLDQAPADAVEAPSTYATPPKPIARRRVAVAEPAPEPSPSGLVEELSRYRRARDLLEAKQYLQASAAFLYYRLEYPKGRLTAEATLGQLEALHRAERTDDVRRLAHEALEHPALQTRRGEVLRVWAEAEVIAGRCDDAAATFGRATKAGAKVDPAQVDNALQACRRRPMP